MEQPPRILVIGTESPAMAPALAGAELTRAEHAGKAADTLRRETFDAVIAEPVRMNELLDRFRRDETILANLDQGVASLNAQGIITWANATLRHWCGSNPVGRTLITALAPCTVTTETAEPVDDAAHLPAQFRVEQPPPSEHPFLEVRVRNVLDADGLVTQRVAIIQDVSDKVEEGRQLDTMHDAGFKLADFETGEVGAMNVPARIELLKANLRDYAKRLLHYDTIEVRLLDRRTMELLPLVEDGMTEEAANRRLFARPEDNGVTGYVAFTGESYLCQDTSKDDHYIRGAVDAKSSLTVPLKHGEDVIGTLNVESPQVNGFRPRDLHFTERFSRELAAALHQLDLLKAQQECTISAIIGEVNKSIAIPLDEILGTAAKLYSRLHDIDKDAAAQLRWIMENARQTRQGVKDVRQELSTPGVLTEGFSLAGKRVLVIDQDERWRRQAHFMLGKMGVIVETVADPVAGLALMPGGKYDAVFLELRPLNMRGYPTFRKFRKANPLARVCLTQICVDHDFSHTKINAGQDGMSALLVKPFREEQVTNALMAPTPPAPAEHAVCLAADYADLHEECMLPKAGS